MKVLVIGANGNTATRVVRRLAAGPHAPVAMMRDPRQREPFDRLGVPTVLGDLEYPIDHCLAGCDAVIFAAGSGGHTGKDKTVLVDHLGAIRAMVSAQVRGVKRFVMLSSLNADIESQSKIAHYHRAKAHADHYLRESDLDYTIVCPGRLTDDPGNDRVTISDQLHGNGKTARDHVAAALVLSLDLANTIGKSFSLLDGDTPIDAALRTV
ncbi:MAG: SDR family oxidoreductase [Planctomycetes bacterium]|nr:SDR family oxidoreductase [Planctomycetota bacterium]